MKEVSHAVILCAFIFLCLYSVNGMAFSEGLLSRLDVLLQESIKCKYHKQNYERSFCERIIPTGLKSNMKQAFKTTAVSFHQQSNVVLVKKAGKVITGGNLNQILQKRLLKELQILQMKIAHQFWKNIKNLSKTWKEEEIRNGKILVERTTSKKN